MTRIRKPRPGPLQMTAAEQSLITKLSASGQLQAYVMEEKRRMETLLRTSWLSVDLEAQHGSTSMTDVLVDAIFEPHPYIRILCRPVAASDTIIAHAVPLVDAAGRSIDDPIADLEEKLATTRLRRSRSLSGPDGNGWRWLTLD